MHLWLEAFTDKQVAGAACPQGSVVLPRSVGGGFTGLPTAGRRVGRAVIVISPIWAPSALVLLGAVKERGAQTVQRTSPTMRLSVDRTNPSIKISEGVSHPTSADPRGECVEPISNLVEHIPVIEVSVVGEVVEADVQQARQSALLVMLGEVAVLLP